MDNEEERCDPEEEPEWEKTRSNFGLVSMSFGPISEQLGFVGVEAAVFGGGHTLHPSQQPELILFNCGVLRQTRQIWSYRV